MESGELDGRSPSIGTGDEEKRMDSCTVVTGAAGGIGRAVAEKLPAARWTTGQSLVCDGGHSLG